MSESGYLKGRCQNCGGHLEFPEAGIGLTISCPHCGSQTTLISNFSADPNRKRLLIWISAIVIVIAAATGGMLHGFKKSGLPVPSLPVQQTAHSEVANPPVTAPETNDSLTAGPVTLQKTTGSALVYAVGTVKNNSGRQRFGVKIELDLLDTQDNKIGVASDYIAILEPHKDWQFRALLVQPAAVRARVAKIEEQK